MTKKVNGALHVLQTSVDVYQLLDGDELRGIWEITKDEGDLLWTLLAMSRVSGVTAETMRELILCWGKKNGYHFSGI